MLAKLDGEMIEYVPNVVRIGGEIVFNPTDEQLKQLGYKELEFSEEPQIEVKTQKAVPKWEERENKIVQIWDIVPAQPDYTYTEVILEMQKTAILKQLSESEDKTIGIQCMALFNVYVQNKQHEVGEVALHPETGYPYECITSYDGTVQQDWTIDNRTLWKPWHSRKKEYALPWEAPTGAHDMYKAGEYMIWTDGRTYKCVQDTNFSPEEYSQAWEIYNAQ